VGAKTGRARLVVRAENIDASREGRGNLSVNPFVAIAPACVVATATTCPDNPDAVAQVAQAQRFHVYTSVFYHQAAPGAFDPFGSR
jgi:hypothetical protein